MCLVLQVPAMPPAAAALEAPHTVQQHNVTAGAEAAAGPATQVMFADAADSVVTSSTGHQIVEGGLSIDIVAAEAAAQQASEQPSQYAVKGIIDPQSQLFSEEPGVLVPLAQAQSPVGDWLAAVEAAGPSTPLSDPMFVGTIFIPSNEAFEEMYPNLRLMKVQGKTAADGFANASITALALELNCLTVPGAALILDDLWPGRLLRTAGFGAIKVIINTGDQQPVQLQHQPSGIAFSIMERDLQSGNAVAHVVDVMPPAAVLSKIAISAGPQQAWQYSSVMMALMDPVRHLQGFAWVVQQANHASVILTQLLDSGKDAFTLFAPDEKAMATLMAALPMESRQRLLTNASLADQFVSSHLVLGTSLGSKALEALLPAGQLRTAQGNLLVTSSTEQPQPTGQLPSRPVTLLEAGKARQQQEAAPAGQLAVQQAHEAAAVAATAASARAPEQVLSHTPVLSVANSAIVATDIVGGKAVIHVVDRVLISPMLAEELGLVPSAGYTMLEAPVALASTSSSYTARAGSTSSILAAACAAVLLVLL